MLLPAEGAVEVDGRYGPQGRCNMTKLGHGSDEYPAGIAMHERSEHGGSAWSGFSDTGGDLEAGGVQQDSPSSGGSKSRSSMKSLGKESLESGTSLFSAQPRLVHELPRFAVFTFELWA